MQGVEILGGRRPETIRDHRRLLGGRPSLKTTTPTLVREVVGMVEVATVMATTRGATTTMGAAAEVGVLMVEAVMVEAAAIEVTAATLQLPQGAME